MHSNYLKEYIIDYVEIYTPMAKVLAYWHAHALGFAVTACANVDTGQPGVSSYVCRSGNICLILTSAYPTLNQAVNNDVTSFISKHYCGVKRFALQVSSVTEMFRSSVEKGAFPVTYPRKLEDQEGAIEEAAVKLFDDSEIVFINRENYRGTFKPGYKSLVHQGRMEDPLLLAVDHIASEVRINESSCWSEYLTNAISTSLVQTFQPSAENNTGMVLNINQSFDKKLTLVIAEPDTYLHKSKVQMNIQTYGPGIHHLAFLTGDMIDTIRILSDRGVEFINFPASYYDLLRKNDEFNDFDIDSLQRHGILIDKEDNTYLLQKFVKPLSDRPFFFYEIVQRVNGYNGFALKNINVLKKAEEIEIMKL